MTLTDVYAHFVQRCDSSPEMLANWPGQADIAPAAFTAAAVLSGLIPAATTPEDLDAAAKSGETMAAAAYRGAASEGLMELILLAAMAIHRQMGQPWRNFDPYFSTPYLVIPPPKQP